MKIKILRLGMEDTYAQRLTEGMDTSKQIKKGRGHESKCMIKW